MTAAGPCAGRTILVTGGSRGIGAATVRSLHRDGAYVVVHYGSSRGSAEELVGQLGERAVAVGADLRDARQRERLWAAGLQILS